MLFISWVRSRVAFLTSLSTSSCWSFSEAFAFSNSASRALISFSFSPSSGWSFLLLAFFAAGGAAVLSLMSPFVRWVDGAAEPWLEAIELDRKGHDLLWEHVE